MSRAIIVITMTTSQIRLVSLLRDRAGWFVILAWLLFVLTILAFLTAGVTSAINAFYHPQHEWANYNRAENRLLQFTFGVALLIALASSVALGLGRRMVASSFVTVCWIGLVAGGAVYLNSVGKGPQFFDRYAGQQHFRIPWQYGPTGSDKPNPNGISVSLCLASLLGTYDAACSHTKQQQFSIYPPNVSFMGGPEENFWQRHPDKMEFAGVQNGHQAYIHSIPAEGGRNGLTIYYFRLTNSEGKLLRTVACFEQGRCEHYAMVGHYLLFYTAPESTFPEWDAMDHRLTTLADSWAVPEPSGSRTPNER